MRNIDVRILDKRLKDHLPAYATAGAAGLDLRACVDAPALLHPGETLLVPTGIAVHLADPGIAAMVLPRSAWGTSMESCSAISSALIDSDYQGQIFVSVWNRGRSSFTLEPMERIAQLVVVPVVQVAFNVVDEFVSSDRGGRLRQHRKALMANHEGIPTGSMWCFAVATKSCS